MQVSSIPQVSTILTQSDGPKFTPEEQSYFFSLGSLHPIGDIGQNVLLIGPVTQIIRIINEAIIENDYVGEKLTLAGTILKKLSHYEGKWIFLR